MTYSIFSGWLRVNHRGNGVCRAPRSLGIELHGTDGNAVDSRICALFYHVIPAKAQILKILTKLDSRLRWNDVKVLLHWLRQLRSTALGADGHDMHRGLRIQERGGWFVPGGTDQSVPGRLYCWDSMMRIIFSYSSFRVFRASSAPGKWGSSAKALSRDSRASSFLPSWYWVMPRW